MRAAALIAAALIAITAAPADAAPTRAAQLIETARGHLRDLDHDDVVASARAAIAAGDATTAELIEARVLEGEALVVLGRKDEAVAAYTALFALDPDYTLPDGTSPNILAVFDPARAAWIVQEEARLQSELGNAYAATAIHVALPPQARGGRPIVVAVDVTDPQRITEEIVVSYRRGGGKHWSTLTAPAHPGRVELAISGAFTASPTPYRLELAVQARHRSGVVLRHEGSSEHPLALEVAAGSVPAAPSITHTWWFWTGVATLALGAVAVPIVIDRVRDVGPQQVVIRSASLVVGRW